MKTRQNRPRLRRAGTLLLALLLLAGVFTGIAPAASAEDAHVNLNALEYTIKNNQVTITGCSRTATGILEIPSAMEGSPVTAIAKDAFSQCSKITNITVPNGVTSIGANAFSGCTSLIGISLPSTLKDIGNGAFSSCKSLISVVIPAGVEKLGLSMFCLCTSLTNVSIPNTVKEIGSYAFDRCSSLETIKLPDSLTSLGYKAFIDCSSLKSITIPGGVKEIGEWTFEGCINLESVTLSNGVEKIGELAFANCSSLTSLTTPVSLTGISNLAFSDCTSLTTVTLNGSFTALTSESIFHGCTALTTLIITAPMEKIGTPYGWYSTFSNCTSLTTLYLPGTLYQINPNTFTDCPITDIYFGGSAYDWAGVGIGSNNASLATATKHYIPFQDTRAGDYYYIPMTWAIDQSVTNGTSETTFSPNATCTQGQILTFLYRAVGEPPVSGGNPYTSGAVTADQYYYKALLWAWQQGVVSDADLDPNAGCRRSDVVLYLWRLDGKPSGGSAGFTDVAASASYAQAVSWAVREGITTGTSATTFSPDTTCTRAQIVTFLYRALAE